MSTYDQCVSALTKADLPSSSTIYCGMTYRPTADYHTFEGINNCAAASQFFRNTSHDVAAYPYIDNVWFELHGTVVDGAVGTI
eukprot:22236-Eustigmatos_ZCMA.PRE.1